MQIARKALLVLLTPLFTVLLFALAFDVGVVRTATHPANVKKIVADSGIYNSLIPGLLDQAKQTTADGGSLSLTDQSIKQAAEDAFNPQFVQKNTETAIDSVYKWLDGKTTQPDFSIDLSGAKTTFANDVAAVAKAKAATLPACSTAFSGSDNFDPFSATCLPAGVSAAEAGTQAKDQILNGDFLNQTNLTAAQAKSSDGKSIFADQLKNVPTQYQRAKKTPLILSILTLLVGAAIVFAGATRTSGLRHIGITLLTVGILMLAFSWALNRVVGQTLVPKITFSNAVLQAKVQTLAKDLAQSVDKNYWFFGGLYTALGVAAIGGPIATRRLRNKPTRKDTPAPAAPAEEAPVAKAEAPAAPKAAAKSKPTKTTIKVI